MHTLYCKKQIDISFSCVCPLIEDKFRHNIVKVWNKVWNSGLHALLYANELLVRDRLAFQKLYLYPVFDQFRVFLLRLVFHSHFDNVMTQFIINKRKDALKTDVNLTNRFHVAVRLFSNRSQMTSKCGKNKKVAHETIAECHWCSYHILTSSVIYYWQTRKKAIWRSLLSIQNEAISLVAMHNKELDSRGMKTYSESRIELRSLQMLKKMLEKSTQFLSLEQPSGSKSLNVSLSIAGVKRIRSENLFNTRLLLQDVFVLYLQPVT